MKSFNPYYLLYIIPFGLVTMVIYFIAIIWSELSLFISIVMLTLVSLTTFIIVRNILKNFHPDFGIVDERAETLQMILTMIESKKRNLDDSELDDIIDKANNISKQNLRPAEKRMKINAMLQKNLKTKNRK